MKKLNLLKKVSSILMLMVFIFAVAPIAFAEGYSCTISVQDPLPGFLYDLFSCCLPQPTLTAYSFQGNSIQRFNYFSGQGRLAKPQIIEAEIKNFSDLGVTAEIKGGGKYALINISGKQYRLNNWSNESGINHIDAEATQLVEEFSQEIYDNFSVSNLDFSNPKNLAILHKHNDTFGLIIATRNGGYSFYTYNSKQHDYSMWYECSYKEEEDSDGSFLYTYRSTIATGERNPRTGRVIQTGTSLVLRYRDKSPAFEKDKFGNIKINGGIGIQGLHNTDAAISGDVIPPYYLLFPLVVYADHFLEC